MQKPGAMQFCNLDAARLGGVNGVRLAVCLLARKFGGIPVCPHAVGGVGLCEYVQHLVSLGLHLMWPPR